MLNDLSLRPKSAKDSTCLDYVVIYEEDRQVIKTCHSYPFNLQVASNTARIALISTSHGWSSKGLWIFYRAVGCSRPQLPELVHLSSHNYTSAVLTCQEGTVFRAFDEPLAEMTLSCLDGKEWHRSVPACVNTTEWRKGALDDGLVQSRANIPIDMLNGANLTQIVIPSAVVGALLLILIAALGIVLTLRRHRRRGIYHTHEIEHLHVKEGPYIVRKAPRAQLDSATDLEGGGYPLTDLRH
ncbi:hypothetical protein RvY_13225-2 [Ramazzottius varieornatus]|nr:hypothetical protein RvY_13225-2 [Ramazzottius varieornatus]